MLASVSFKEITVIISTIILLWSRIFTSSFMSQSAVDYNLVCWWHCFECFRQTSKVESTNELIYLRALKSCTLPSDNGDFEIASSFVLTNVRVHFVEWRVTAEYAGNIANAVPQVNMLIQAPIFFLLLLVSPSTRVGLLPSCPSYGHSFLYAFAPSWMTTVKGEVLHTALEASYDFHALLSLR